MNIDSMLRNFQSQIHQHFRKSSKVNHILHGGTDLGPIGHINLHSYIFDLDIFEKFLTFNSKITLSLRQNLLRKSCHCCTTVLNIQRMYMLLVLLLSN